MAQAPQTGMEKAEMKQLLAKSKQEPVNCAFGQSGAKGGEAFAVLLLHKVKNPKALHKELEGQFPDAKNTRWGTALVEPDVDATLVKITANREVTGIARRMVKTLKGTGYRKVEIYLEDGSKIDGAAEEEEEGAAAEASADSVPPAPPPAPPAPPPAAPATLGLADLQKLLAALIPRIGPAAGQDAELRAKLSKLAGDAGGHLKSSQLAEATAAIGELKKQLDAAPAAGASASPAPSPAPAPATTGAVVAYTKSRLAWLAARKKVESEIEKLRAELAASYADNGMAADIERSYGERVASLMAGLDESLADKLGEASNATDPAARAKLVEEARAIMARYQGFVAGEPLIADLDANPFVPLAIQQTLTATLTGLSAAIR